MNQRFPSVVSRKFPKIEEHLARAAYVHLARRASPRVAGRRKPPDPNPCMARPGRGGRDYLANLRAPPYASVANTISGLQKSRTGGVMVPIPRVTNTGATGPCTSPWTYFCP